MSRQAKRSPRPPYTAEERRRLDRVRAPMPLAEDQDAAACSQPRVLAGLVVRSPSGFCKSQAICKSQAMEMERR